MFQDVHLFKILKMLVFESKKTFEKQIQQNFLIPIPIPNKHPPEKAEADDLVLN